MRRYDQNKEDLNNWIAIYLSDYLQIASSFLQPMTKFFICLIIS